MTELILAKNESDFKTIAKLAHTIWHHHYEPIIGINQVEYMLDKFQSIEAIKSQINDGYEYYLVNYNSTSVGYISIKKDDDALFLSKIYVLSDYRGKKIGKTAMQFISDRAKNLNCNTIRLTVNKYNTNSIKAYERLGFKTIEALVIDIGNGYIMDDYKMEKTIG
ncbi:GNAT family N-acetyltransferase [Ichthyenterobacterium magnum]|uniref:RimJ/RimL family protein N-acetyltransferase n=1 Tax=Ichthyenterobacterium magnum TaxID=1230530 RepID=A0A420DKM1_9FLAO|nr:GNAT family N-acetyltransferase [Ichthyenterobacterium magnum]RKE94759.1 RimJ/RimL family protein N-acetyltransferase [Ichthyenterobacterium magnum]